MTQRRVQKMCYITLLSNNQLLTGFLRCRAQYHIVMHAGMTWTLELRRPRYYSIYSCSHFLKRNIVLTWYHHSADPSTALTPYQEYPSASPVSLAYLQSRMRTDFFSRNGPLDPMILSRSRPRRIKR